MYESYVKDSVYCSYVYGTLMDTNKVFISIHVMSNSYGCMIHLRRLVATIKVHNGSDEVNVHHYVA